MWIWSTVDLDLCSKSLEFLDLCSKPTAGLSTDLDASGVENGWICMHMHNISPALTLSVCLHKRIIQQDTLHHSL